MRTIHLNRTVHELRTRIRYAERQYQTTKTYLHLLKSHYGPAWTVTSVSQSVMGRQPTPTRLAMNSQRQKQLVGMNERVYISPP
jgi:hypothetical protein